MGLNWGDESADVGLQQSEPEDDTYLQCSSCERKSYGPAVLGSTCGMIQPDDSVCKGIMQGKSNTLNS